MAYFPFMVDIEHWNCLVVGGGKVALHKTELLLPFGVRIKVVAKEFCPKLWEKERKLRQEADNSLELIQRPFADSDIEHIDMVVAATDDNALNDHISALCRERKIPVNVVDTKEDCSFVFPAIVQDKDLLVAVSSGGVSPAMVSHVKQKIQAELPPYYGEMTEQMGRCRERVYRAVETAAGRKRAFALLMQYGDTHEGRIPREVVDSVIDQVNRENTGSKKIIRIGTRGSRLALAQAQMVKDALTGRYPEYTVETVILRTEGDKRLDQPLPAFGGKGVFVTAFEEALAQGSIDLAVHSAKDMPMELAEGMTIAGVLPRGDVRDVLVLKQGKTLSAPLVIGTGSLRRQAQLKELYPQMQCVSIRGNVPTRLQKVRDGILDGVVLAAAGLERLALTGEPEFSYLFLPCDGMLPAGGQGIIAVEGRKEDRISKLAEGISDALTLRELEAERAMMRRLNAGCHEAVGVLAKTEADGEGQQISLQVFRGQDGRLCRVSGKESAAAWPALVEKLARQLEEEQHG